LKRWGMMGEKGVKNFYNKKERGLA
jgi:hypothetical protein